MTYIAYRIPGGYDESDRLFATLEKAVRSFAEEYPASDCQKGIVQGILSKDGEIIFEPCDISSFFIRIPVSEDERARIYAEAKEAVDLMRRTDEEWKNSLRSRADSGQQILVTGCGGGGHTNIFDTSPRSDQYWSDYLERYFQSLLDEKEIQWNLPSQN